jgi:hypothetical protein
MPHQESHGSHPQLVKVNGIKCGHKDFFISAVTVHEVLLPRNSTQGGEEQGPIRTGGTRQGASRAQESSAARRRAQPRAGELSRAQASLPPLGQRGHGRGWARARALKGLPAATPCGATRWREGEPRRGHARPTRLWACARMGEKEGTRGHG